MKRIRMKILTLLLIAVAVSGCSTAPQESAMDWMKKQPNYLDP